MKKQHHYQWKGITAQGNKINSSSFAFDETHLKKQLRDQNILLIQSRKERSIFRRKPTAKQLLQFTQELSLLFKTGIPIIDALEILCQQQSQTMKLITQTLIHKLNNGIALNQAFSQLGYFDKLYCSMVQAGEESSQLGKTLQQLVMYLKNSRRIKTAISKALFYPIFVLLCSIVFMIVLLIFVIPHFEKIFLDFNVPLPLFTKLIIQLSKMLSHFSALILLLIFGITTAFVYLRKRAPSFRFYTDQLIRNIPLLGPLLDKIILGRWAYLLATTLHAGIPLLDALNTANQSIHNRSLFRSMQSTLARVNAGQSLHTALQTIPAFPTNITRMIAVGEKSSQLPTLLSQVSEYLQTDIENSLDYLSKMVEPAIMLLLAGMVGCLVIAIYLPVFKIGSLM